MADNDYSRSPYAGKAALLHLVDEDGYTHGILDPSEPVGVGSGPVVSVAMYLDDLISHDTPEVESNIVNLKGGQRLLAKARAGLNSIGSFEIVNATLNSAISRLSNGVGVNTDQWQGYRQGGYTFTPGNLKKAGLTLIDSAFRRTDVGFEPGEYMTQNWLSVQIEQGYTGAGQVEGEVDNPNPITSTVFPSESEVFWTGQRFDDMDDVNYPNGSTIMHEVQGPEMWTLGRIWFDGTATQVTLPYKPLYSDTALGGRNMVFKNGVQVAPSSITPATGVIAFSAAPLITDKIVFLIPTRYVET